MKAQRVWVNYLRSHVSKNWKLDPDYIVSKTGPYFILKILWGILSDIFSRNFDLEEMEFRLKLIYLLSLNIFSLFSDRNYYSREIIII